ncbi:hypothetical protein MACH01_10920 [Thalassospira tepidiphila]|nr:hypothetical protein MACH01_10920 [Thalassospira tepidiphila]
MKRENLSDQLLRYERELAIHLRKSIINVVLNGPVKMPVEFAKYPLVRIVEPTNSLINMNAMRTLIELLRGVESEQEV